MVHGIMTRTSGSELLKVYFSHIGAEKPLLSIYLPEVCACLHSFLNS